jgi:hypothetical protein
VEDFGASVIRVDKPGEGEGADTLGRGVLILTSTHSQSLALSFSFIFDGNFFSECREEIHLFGFKE